MNDSIYKRIEQNPRFHQLVSMRDRFAWRLSAIMFGLYILFILLIAFLPELLGTPIREGSPITIGIPTGIGLIFAAFLLTGIYVQRANSLFDEINQAIIREAQL